jgi:hypothetical protein
MILNFLVLLLSATSWIAALWLLIAPDFSKWSHPGVIALHALPPLTVWLFWIVLRRRAQKRKADEAAQVEVKAQAEREAARRAAQQKHEEEMRQRRFGCDCRVVAMINPETSAPLSVLETEVQNVVVRLHDPEKSEEPAQRSVIDRLLPAVAEALASIYSTCGAAVAFPIFVQPPSEVSGEVVVAHIRAIHTNLVQALDPPAVLSAGQPEVLFLPTGDSASNSVISLFENIPDLPAAIVLAFDSPFSRAAPRDEFDGEPDPQQSRKQQFLGKPSEAAIALLLTNAELPSMLAALAGFEDGSIDRDAMTPFWQKAIQPGGNLALLARAPVRQREELGQLPVLGRIHRALFRQPDQQRSGVLDMTRMAQSLLERAQINAGLIDSPFELDDKPEDKASAESVKPEQLQCRRIVHNAGGPEVAGKRLAALGGALYYFNIDLNPVDADIATNIVTRVGDLGRVSGIGQLALSVAHAAASSAPALDVEFSQNDGVALAFVMPMSATT